MQLKKRIREFKAQTNDAIRLTEDWWSKNPNWSKEPNLEKRRRINYLLVEIRSECTTYLNELQRIESAPKRFE
jgi:hypothetical protein